MKTPVQACTSCVEEFCPQIESVSYCEKPCFDVFGSSWYFNDVPRICVWCSTMAFHPLFESLKDCFSTRVQQFKDPGHPTRLDSRPLSDLSSDTHINFNDPRIVDSAMNSLKRRVPTYVREKSVYLNYRFKPVRYMYSSKPD